MEIFRIEKGKVLYVYPTDGNVSVESDVKLLAFDNPEYEKNLREALKHLIPLSTDFKITLTIE